MNYQMSEKIKEFVLAQKEELSWFLNELSPDYKIGDKLKIKATGEQMTIISCETGPYMDRPFFRMESADFGECCYDAETIKEFMEKV